MSAFVFKKTPPSTVAPPVTTEDVKFFFDADGVARVWQGGQAQPGFVAGSAAITDEMIRQALLRILVEGNNITITEQGSQIVLSATTSQVAAPVITTAPSIISAIAGQALTFTSAVATGAAPITYSYSIWINNQMVQSNATSGTYVIPMNTEGQSVYVLATATNAGGSDTQASNSVVIQTEQQAQQTYAAGDYFITDSDYNANETISPPAGQTYAVGDYFVTNSDYALA